MRRLLVLLSVAALVAVGLAIIARSGGPARPFDAASKEAQREAQAREHEPGEGEGEENEGAPDDWFVSQRVTHGGVPAGAGARAAAQANRVGALTAARAPDLARAPWTFVGPTNIGGRVLDVVIDPAQPTHIWIASASGGVWRSTDGGSTFTSAWPSSNPQAIGALAMGPTGILYAGTGEAGPGGGSITYGGNGLYRSTDGGRTWKKSGLPGTFAIGRIVVDFNNPQRVFVAAAGDLFNAGGQRGVYRSTDGGRHWTQVLAGSTDTTGAVDLAMDATNPNVVYAAMWDHLRQPNLRTYGGVGSGIYKSTDGGDTWNRLAGGLPGPSANIGRIGIAVAPQNPQDVYAIVIQTGGLFEGFYRSTNGGTSWTKINDASLSGSQSSYGWWFGRVWVAPDSANHLYAAGVSLEVSTNGGTSWSGTGAVHADQHAMAWDPTNPNHVYLGNDGGVYHSTNGGAGWTFATSQPFTQFYSVDVSEQDQTRIVGGAQDNGANRSYPGSWNTYVGGDGEEALIDPTNQNDVYGCSQYGACLRSTDGGNSMLSFGGTTSDRYNWFTPVQFDPSNPAVMYLGGNKLNRSTNRAQSFTVISPDLTGGPGPDPNYPFGTITTVAASKANGNELLVGTDDGRVWFTTDLGAHWTRVDPGQVPGFWVSRVTWDTSNASVGYATFSGYRGGDEAAYVKKTTDGGTTWTDITGNLPLAPVNDIVVSGGTLYVATDVGVYQTTDGGTTWLRVGQGLPRVPVDDIELVASSNQLFAGTFGRGMWSISLTAP
jgi:photosystem II stability/assembly factor-like uncharacterized protein